MKTMLKLAVLITTLLLLSGVSFGEAPCYYYEVELTNLADGTVTPELVQICLDPGNDYGQIDCCCILYQTLTLFFDSMNQQALGSGTGCTSYLKFHGDYQHIVTGITFCDGQMFSLRGIKTDVAPIVSDVTWKKNIEPLSSSLEKVMLLQGVSYDWKTDEYPEKGFTDNRQIGFIAQDVEKVFPELVRTDGNGYKAVYYSQMVPVLLEAIKEQQKEISELKQQQAMIVSLTEKIAQLEKALEMK
jgi:hypothetical protein